jgi:hypothetical protein
MSDFRTIATDVRTLDPSKRVNYSFGLVLGVDEFLQEQTYFLERHHRHVRMLHGYGTVWGLKLSVSEGDPVEIRVSPGLAVTPSGHDICVPTLMCARLNDWLDARRDALGEFIGTGTALTLCVALCHRECATDVVPLPGEPCRTDEDVMAPSRIADTFEIKLQLADGAGGGGSPPGLEMCQPPTVRGAGLRAFSELLQRIHVTGGATKYAKLATIENAVRGLAEVDPWTPGWVESRTDFYVKPADARTTFNAVARVWAIEVMPVLLRRDAAATCEATGDHCVLLGAIEFQVSALGTVQGGVTGVTIDESNRPILLSTEVLQEWSLGLGPTEHVRVRRVPP